MFQLSRFAKGKDMFWKPYVAQILGYSGASVLARYKLKDREAELTSEIRKAERRATATADQRDEIQAQMEVIEGRKQDLVEEIESMDLRKSRETEASELIERVDEQISQASARLLSIESRLHSVSAGLDAPASFDLERTRTLFQEIDAHIDSDLLKSYEDLIAFREQILRDRAPRMLELKEQLAVERETLRIELGQLYDRRATLLRKLTRTSAMRDMRQAQRNVLRAETRLLELQGNLQVLNEAAELADELRDVQRELEAELETVRKEIRSSPARLKVIRRLFAKFVRAVVSIDATLVVALNKKQNMEFDAKVLGDVESGLKSTREDEGFSYRKLLCACYDLAVLEAYSKEPFYRFVYHDGVFESLDDRRKLALLDTVRSFAERTGCQYILTVIDSDIPRDESGAKLMFSQDEIIGELSDDGDQGRLFRMPKF